MSFGRKLALALSASIALLALSATVFASGGPGGSITPGSLVGNNVSGGGTCNFTVTNLSVVSKTSFPLSQLTLAITVQETKNDGGPWYFPNPSMVANNPQALPNIQIYQNNHAEYPPGGISPTSILNPDVSVMPGNSATAEYTYSLSPALPAGSYTVQLVPNPGGNVFHMYNSLNQTGKGVGTAPVCLQSPIPVGQLPEVPFAVGIPLVGIGVAALVWYRRRLRVPPTV